MICHVAALMTTELAFTYTALAAGCDTGMHHIGITQFPLAQSPHGFVTQFTYVITTRVYTVLTLSFQ